MAQIAAVTAKHFPSCIINWKS